MTTATIITSSMKSRWENEIWRAIFAGYHVKIRQQWEAREGRGMNADLEAFENGKLRKIADVRDDGNGGCFFIQPTDAVAYKAFADAVKNLPREQFKYSPDGMQVNTDMAIDILATVFEMAKTIKKAKRVKFVVALYNEKREVDDMFEISFAHGTDPVTARQEVAAKYPDGFIYNDIV